MTRVTLFISFAMVASLGLLSSSASAATVRGHYMEARTCQVYTGPCFAAGEVGLTGKDAVMAWHITEGRHDGIDLSDLNVIVIVKSTDTLGFEGLENARRLKSLVVVDSNATSQQQRALLAFAKQRAGKAGRSVTGVFDAPISMKLDIDTLTGNLRAGDCVQLVTRKARPGDCICSNESAYYPPLAQVENFVPGVTIDGEVKGRGLGTRWSIPDSRSAYMGTFAY